MQPCCLAELLTGDPNETRGEGAVDMVAEWQQLFLSLASQKRNRLRGLFCHVLIFFRFDAASAVNQDTAWL
jgi:hypothetical protein